MKTHALKTWPVYFEAILDRKKTFDIRYDDRGFMVGDLLRLLEWDPDSKKYTGREVQILVTYLLSLSDVVKSIPIIPHEWVAIGFKITAAWTRTQSERILR